MNVRKAPPHVVRFHLRRLVIDSAALGSGPHIEATIRSALIDALSSGPEGGAEPRARLTGVAQVAQAVSAATWNHPSVADVAATRSSTKAR